MIFKSIRLHMWEVEICFNKMYYYDKLDQAPERASVHSESCPHIFQASCENILCTASIKEEIVENIDLLWSIIKSFRFHPNPCQRITKQLPKTSHVDRILWGHFSNEVSVSVVRMNVNPIWFEPQFVSCTPQHQP